VSPIPQNNKKLSRELGCLDGFFNPQANHLLAIINKDQPSSTETTTQNNTQEETITEEEKP
jgi:hypothetical protein